MLAYHGYDLKTGEITMIKLTKIDAIMIIIAVVAILPELYIAPDKASALYNGVYGFTCLTLTFLFGVMLTQLLNNKRQS